MQLLAIGGNAGKQPNSLKPFDKLKKKELLEELKKRGFMDIYDFTKPQLESKLVNELKGVQRVPALLLP